jgi:hypothetical protein
MTELMEKTFDWLDRRLPGQVSRLGDAHYAAATAIWAKAVGRMPRAVVHCRNADDVQSAVRAARDCDLPLSVRGGGHDWAGRALCDGIVLDLRAMRDVRVSSDQRSAWIGGGVRAADVLAVTDPLGVAAVAGSVGSVGMAGFTLGGGYGALIGRFGLALDNLVAAEVVLADGRIVVAAHDQEEELLWASSPPCTTACTRCPVCAPACWFIPSAKPAPCCDAAPMLRPPRPRSSRCNSPSSPPRTAHRCC